MWTDRHQSLYDARTGVDSHSTLLWEGIRAQHTHGFGRLWTKKCTVFTKRGHLVNLPYIAGMWTPLRTIIFKPTQHSMKLTADSRLLEKEATKLQPRTKFYQASQDIYSDRCSSMVLHYSCSAYWASNLGLYPDTWSPFLGRRPRRISQPPTSQDRRSRGRQTSRVHSWIFILSPSLHLQK